MKKLKLLYTAGLAIALLHTSCSDFLEPESDTEYTPEYAEGLNEMLLGSSYPNATGTGFFGFLSILDDDVTARPYVATPASELVSYYLSRPVNIGASVLYGWSENYETDLENGGGSGNTSMYRDIYVFLVGANAALDYVDDMKGETNEKRNVKAQAHALRALFYFQLVNIYGAPYPTHPDALGVPLKLTSRVEDKKLTRNTVRECYEQIVADLLEAIENYTAMGEEHKWTRNYRTSLPMAQLLLSRVYLYMEQWDKAAFYAQKVIDNGQFLLYNLNDYATPTPARNTTEYRNFVSYDSPETIWLFGASADLLACNSLVLGTSTASTPALFNSSAELLESYNEKINTGDDLRPDHYIVSEKYQFAAQGLKRAYGKVTVGTYANGRWPLTGATNFASAFRLSEAYLNYAEAHAMMVKENISGGSQTEALDALNTLRANRILTVNFVSLAAADFASPDELVSFARNERRRELCFEGHRWFDLRRYGMPSVKHVWIDDNYREGREITLPAQAPFYAIPIPPSILNENPALDSNTWQ